MRSFVSKAKQLCPKAVISFMFVSKDYKSWKNRDKLITRIDVYKALCEKYGVLYVENSDKILLTKRDIFCCESDPNSGYHPNNQGVKKICICIGEYLSTGKIKDKRNLFGEND